MTASPHPDYELDALVNDGACGQLHLGKDRSPGGQKVAVKMLRSIAISRRVLEPALGYLQQHRDSLAGVNPVRAYNLSAPPYSIVTDWLDESEGWTTLQQLPKGKTEVEKWPLFLKTAKVLAQLHRHGLTHGNLKSTNVFANQKTGDTQVTDLCLGMVGGAHHIDFRDHPLYMAPEQMRRPEGILEGSGHRWDVYSFGVLAFSTITGRFPRANRSAAIIREQGVEAARLMTQAILPEVMAQPEVRWPDAPGSEAESRYRAIVDRCLALDPEERWVDMREVDRAFASIAQESEVTQAKEATEKAREEARQEFLDFKKKSESASARNRFLMKLGYGLLAGVTAYALLTQFRLFRASKAVRNAESEKAAAIQDTESKLKASSEQIASLQSASQTTEKALVEAEKRGQIFLSGWIDQHLSGSTLVEPTPDQIQTAVDSVSKLISAPPQTLDDRIAQGFAYGNLAFLQQKLERQVEATASWTRSADFLDTALQSSPPPEAIPGIASRLVAARESLANLQESAGRPIEALESAQKAAEALKVLAGSRPDDPVIRRKAADANLRIAEILVNQGRDADAEKWLASVESLAVQGAEDTLSTESRLLMARVSYFRALSERRQTGNEKKAMETLVKAVDYLKTAGITAEFGADADRMLMARAYTDLGEMVGRHVAANDGLQAHTAAVQILERFIRGKSASPETAFLFARNYSEIAHYERDAGKTKEALERQSAAVNYLKQLLATASSDFRYNLAYGVALQREAGLLEELDGKEKSLETAREAVYVITNTLAEHRDEIIPYWINEAKFSLAQAQRTYGHILQDLKQTDLAREQYEASKKLWDELKEAGFNPEMTASGIADLQHLLDLLPKAKVPVEKSADES